MNLRVLFNQTIIYYWLGAYYSFFWAWVFTQLRAILLNSFILDFIVAVAWLPNPFSGQGSTKNELMDNITIKNNKIYFIKKYTIIPCYIFKAGDQWDFSISKHMFSPSTFGWKTGVLNFTILYFKLKKINIFFIKYQVVVWMDNH